MRILICLILCWISGTLPGQRNELGVPGPDYWQNRANYDIEVELDDEKHRISGSLTLEYINNSPYPLDFLWFHLDQNAFKPESLGNQQGQSDSRFASSPTEGMEIREIRLLDKQQSLLNDLTFDDTRMQLRLPEPIPANGGSRKLYIEYAYTIPEQGADRTGRGYIGEHYVYSIAQWYPRVAVFDDLQGWNTMPYLGMGEFYCEYGDFDYRIQVPAGYTVAGSGELINAKKVLRGKYRKRLEAVKSEEISYIIPEEEVGKRTARKKAVWHFRLENARDVSWACSKDFIWNATKAILPEGKEVLCSAYFVPGLDEAWKLGPQHLKTSLEFYSQKWYPYPYGSMDVISSTVGGIEYPALTFVPSIRAGNAFWRTADHEVAHNWFPMVMGTNERKHFWLDEGLVTFMGYYAAEATGKYQSYMSNLSLMADRLAHTEACQTITPPDEYDCGGYYDAMYFRPALGYILLREYILEPEVFDRAFRSFLENWAFKHPTHEDLFRHFEQMSGQDLSWFWESWFNSTEKLDQSIISLAQPTGEAATITLGNLGGLNMPVEMQLEFADGSTERIRLPVEIWDSGPTWTLESEPTKQIIRAELDPRHILPDVERQNNIYIVE